MNQTITVCPKAGDVSVLYEVLFLFLERIVLIPVTADGENFLCSPVDSDYIRQGNSRELARFLIFVLKPRKVEIY